MESSLIKTIVDAVVELNKNLGIKTVLKYLVIVLFLFGLFNFKTIATNTIQFFDEISRTIHDGRMEKRDELIIELSPLLSEFRTATGADRILYIEYHNSKENLIGIPFKYLDLVLTSKRYGVSEFDIKKYHELNAGILSPIFSELRKTGYVVNRGSQDHSFRSHYHEVSDFVNAQDGSTQQIYLNLPGVNSPIGIIILEWISDEDSIEKEWDNLVNISRDYVTRINGLVLSKSSY